MVVLGARGEAAQNTSRSDAPRNVGGHEVGVQQSGGSFHSPRCEYADWPLCSVRKV